MEASTRIRADLYPAMGRQLIDLKVGTALAVLTVNEAEDVSAMLAELVKCARQGEVVAHA